MPDSRSLLKTRSELTVRGSGCMRHPTLPQGTTQERFLANPGGVDSAGQARGW